MPDSAPAAAEPRPAASVIIVRDAPPGAPEPIEVYMVRRQRSMKFLGGFYAFPGGKVDPGDAASSVLDGCRGLDAARAAECFPAHGDLPPLAFWVTAVRELLEESGVVLVGNGADFGALLAEAGWCCDLRPLRYLSHFVTPRTSPIRFSARFFLCRLPAGQAPRLYTEETSEGFWIHPGDGYRRFRANELAMAEPAEYGLAYIAQFRSVDELWAACDDNCEKFTGIVDRIEFQFWKDFDWRAGRWNR